jgi:hypothetical protein
MSELERSLRSKCLHLKVLMRSYPADPWMCPKEWEETVQKVFEAILRDIDEASRGLI